MQAHVFERALHAAALDRVGFMGGIGHLAVDVKHHFGRCAPSDLRLDIGSVEFKHFVKRSTFVGNQGAPIGHGLCPMFAFGRKRLAFHIIDGGLIHGHEA